MLVAIQFITILHIIILNIYHLNSDLQKKRDEKEKKSSDFFKIFKSEEKTIPLSEQNILSEMEYLTVRGIYYIYGFLKFIYVIS